MKYAIMLLLLTVLFQSESGAATVNIVLIGDSNLEWNDSNHGDLAAKLQSSLHAAHPSATYTIYNNGVGGSTSKDALDNFASQVTPYSPNLVIFMHGGTNDGYYTYMSMYPTIYNPTAYASRLTSYKALVDALPTHPLILFVEAAAHATNGDGFGYPYYRNYADVNPIRLQMASLAAGWGLPVVNWYTEMTADPTWEADYILDGVHVNSAAKDVLTVGIMTALAPYLASDGSVAIPPPPTSHLQDYSGASLPPPTDITGATLTGKTDSAGNPL